MEKSEDTKVSILSVEVHADSMNELRDFIQTLEQKTTWFGEQIVKFNDFWIPVKLLKPILLTRKHFNAKDTDIILSSMPKSGTTWLKALTFSIVNRHIYTIDQSPLLTSNPHEVVPFFEFHTYFKQRNPNLETLPNPRIFSTHMPFSILPDSIRDSKCKIIYICRNPLDIFTSLWNFIRENYKLDEVERPVSVDEAFDLFCQGYFAFGPIWDHILEYWNAHLNNPEKVLFLKYEDLQEDVIFYMKKIAEFIGLPFSLDEEKQGLIEQISGLCSFDNLNNLDVNKTGSWKMYKYSSFFRKGKVGDWANYLTPAMAESMQKLMDSKLMGSGLTFKTYDKASC